MNVWRCDRSRLYILAVLLVVAKHADAYSPVLSWDVCSPSRIVVTLTGGADGGIIYIRGYGSACKQDTTSNVTTHEFAFDACGIAKAETYFTIIVQKNPFYQTGSDLQESLLCIYDLSDISVNNGVNVGNKDDDAGINKTVKPTAHMKLYKDGVDVSGKDVKLTDLVTMMIELDEEYLDDFDIKAKSCTANHIDITTSFCAVDSDLFPNFGQVTQGVVTSSFGAFRTTDLSGGFVEMIFTCTVQVCRGPCTVESCNGEDGWGRKKRSAVDDVAVEDLNVGTSMSVGTAIDVTPSGEDEEDHICLHNIAFIAILLVMGIAVVTSLGTTAVVSGKLQKRNKQLGKLSQDELTRQTPDQPSKTTPHIAYSNNSASVTSSFASGSKQRTSNPAGANSVTSFPTSTNPKTSQPKLDTANSKPKQTSSENKISEKADPKCQEKLEISEKCGISNDELEQLRQCREFLKTMQLNEMIKRK